MIRIELLALLLEELNDRSDVQFFKVNFVDDNGLELVRDLGPVGRSCDAALPDGRSTISGDIDSAQSWVTFSMAAPSYSSWRTPAARSL